MEFKNRETFRRKCEKNRRCGSGLMAKCLIYVLGIPLALWLLTNLLN
jgi:hypothetical protein